MIHLCAGARCRFDPSLAKKQCGPNSRWSAASTPVLSKNHLVMRCYESGCHAIFFKRKPIEHINGANLDKSSALWFSHMVCWHCLQTYISMLLYTSAALQVSSSLAAAASKSRLKDFRRGIALTAPGFGAMQVLGS